MKLGAEWPGIQNAIVGQRHGDRAGKPFDERQYDISRVIASTAQFHRIMRGHWSIEKRWHWVKDVTLNEDHAPQTGRMVRHFFINLARRLGVTSIAAAKRQFANQLDNVFPLLQ